MEAVDPFEEYYQQLCSQLEKIGLQAPDRKEVFHIWADGITVGRAYQAYWETYYTPQSK